VQINSGIRTLLKPKEPVALIETRWSFQLGAIAAMMGEVVALARIVTSSRDRYEIVNRPDER
jgi:hypothetical protein